MVTGLTVVLDHPDLTPWTALKIPNEDVIPGKEADSPSDRFGSPKIPLSLQEPANASGIHVPDYNDRSGKSFGIGQHGLHLVFSLSGKDFQGRTEVETVGSELALPYFKGSRHGNALHLFYLAGVGQEDLLVFQYPPGRKQGIAEVLAMGRVNHCRVIDIVQTQPPGYPFDAGFIHFLQGQYIQVLQGLAFFEKPESPINVPGKLDIKRDNPKGFGLRSFGTTMASGKPRPGLVWEDLTGPASILAADRFRNNRHPISSPLPDLFHFFQFCILDKCILAVKNG
jgi:hypothetical protein